LGAFRALPARISSRSKKTSIARQPQYALRKTVEANLHQRQEALGSRARHPNGVLNVVVIDGSRFFSEVLAARLAAEHDVRVLYASTSPEALWRAVTRSSVDVVVCDAVLFGLVCDDCQATEQRICAWGGGWEKVVVQRPAAQEDTAVVLVADVADRHLLARAVRAGVRGWVPRDASADDLVSAIREASDGGTWIPPKLLTDLLAELSDAPPLHQPVQQPMAALTPREREVLGYLAEGLSRAEVAGRLHLSANTIRTHVQSILAKLDVSSSVAAVALLRRTTRV
jgi:DNA-binding NarL/FixJ family response regulator